MDNVAPEEGSLLIEAGASQPEGGAWNVAWPDMCTTSHSTQVQQK